MYSKLVRLALAVAAAIMIASLSAAVAGSAPAHKQATVVKLNVLWPSNFSAGMKIIVKNFNGTHPNIQVEAQYLSADAADALLLTQLAAGNAPDIFGANPGRRATGVWDFAEAGRLLDLTGAKWNARIYGPIRAAVMRGKKVYAWPYVVNPFDVIINTDLFSQLKLTPPTNFAQVLAMCRKITAAGKIPFTQGFAETATGTIVGRQRMVQYVDGVDPNWATKRAKKQVSFARDAKWRRVLQSIVDMKNAGCFNRGTEGTSRAQSYANFARGDAVMSIIASSEIANFLAINRDLKYAIMNLPPDVAKNATVPALATSVIVGNAKTSNPGAVRTFIAFFAREQQNSTAAKADGVIAPLDFKKGKLPPHMTKYLGPLIKQGKFADAQNVQWPNSRIFVTFSSSIRGLFTGQTTVTSILQQMDKDWDTPA